MSVEKVLVVVTVLEGKWLYFYCLVFFHVVAFVVRPDNEASQVQTYL